MPKYLVGQQTDKLEDLLIISASSKKQAIELYKSILVPTDGFIEYLHEWAINMSFSEMFHCQVFENTIRPASYKKVVKAVNEYFLEKPEFAKIYLSHWYEKKVDWQITQMKRFPEEMIDWIWKKEINSGDWTEFKAINLDIIRELKNVSS